MFESAIITRAGVERQIDLGLVAETIFFYRSVQIILNRSSLTALASTVPTDDLISFFKRPEIKLSYLHPAFGVASAGLPRAHQFMAFTFRGTKEKQAPHYKDEISVFLERKLGSGSAINRLIKVVLDRAKLHRFSDPSSKELAVVNQAKTDASDKQFVRAAAALILKHLLPEYVPPSDFRFEMFDVGDGYAVDTNINFEELNKLYHQRVPPSHSSLNPEFLLAHILEARVDSYFSANYMAEIVTSPLYSDIIKLKHFDFLNRRNANAEEIALFQETHLQGVPTLREAINTGQRSMAEFLKLLDSAERFRDWLQGTNLDAGIIQSYYQAATEKTWADKLPTKSIRFIFATGAGILADAIMPTGIGTASGIGLGAADSFYLDRLVKGWRPNQFIEGPYRDFVEGRDK